MSFKKKRYRLKLADPWLKHRAEELVLKNAEKYLKFKEKVKGELKPLNIEFYLEVEEWGDERFEMPCAETCFVELDEDKLPSAFYRVKVYFHLEDGEFIYVSKGDVSRDNICE